MKCHLFKIFWQWAYPKYSRKENESKSFFEENEQEGFFEKYFESFFEMY